MVVIVEVGLLACFCTATIALVAGFGVRLLFSRFFEFVPPLVEERSIMLPRTTLAMDQLDPAAHAAISFSVLQEVLRIRSTLQQQELMNSATLAQWQQHAQEPASADVKLEMKQYQSSEKLEECAVCLDKLEHGDAVACGNACSHTYHHKCLQEWVNHRGQTCPLCRASLTRPSSQAQ